jgi:protein MpaA
MRAIIQSSEKKPQPTKTRVRSMRDLLAPLEAIAAHSTNLITASRPLFENKGEVDARPGLVPHFEINGERYELPRYIFLGPRGGDAPIRLGIFAAIHGDEPEGAHALVNLLQLLETHPEVATGYLLAIYPVCNPSGFEDHTRASRSGKDLNREFWKNSSQPEVRLLQAELVARSFHGIISLLTDSTSEGFYGIVRGATLTKYLIEPALAAAELFLPRDERLNIDGFTARNGVVRDSRDGVLSAPPKAHPRPFEIILATPKSPPSYLKECAFVAALQSILIEYRKFIAYAPNL